MKKEDEILDGIADAFREIAETTGKSEYLESADDFSAKAEQRHNGKPFEGSGLLDITTFFDADDSENLQESASHRSRKGYCDYDLMDMDLWLMNILPDMLREMKQRTIATPFECIEDEYKENRALYTHIKEDELHMCINSDEAARHERRLLDDNAHKRWQDTLEEIATAFDTLSDTETLGLGYEEEPSQYQDRLETQKGKAFDLLKKWFFSLRM